MYLASCLMFAGLCLKISCAMQDAQLKAQEAYGAKKNSVIFWELHPALTNTSLIEVGKGSCANIDISEPVVQGYLKSCRMWRFNGLAICELSCGGQVVIVCWQKKNWYPLELVSFCSDRKPTSEQKCRLPKDRICTSMSSISNSMQFMPLRSNITCLCPNNCRDVTLTCSAGGLWTGDNQCNAESYQDGALIVDVKKTSLSFSCAENHRLAGQSSSMCLNGLLSHDKPVCEPVKVTDTVRLVLYCVSAVLIALCLAGVLFVMRRRRSMNKAESRTRRIPHDSVLVSATVRPDTSHYEEMNTASPSVVYDEVSYCNTASLSYPTDPLYVNTAEPYLTPIVIRRTLKPQ